MFKMPLVKVWKHDRSVKKVAMVNTLEEIKEFGHTKLGYQKDWNLTVVFEADGTEIDSNYLFQCLVEEAFFPSTIIMIVPENHSWTPANLEASSEFNASTSNHDSVVVDPDPISLKEVPSTSVTYPSPELHNFEMPWKILSPQFLDDCKNERRPSPAVRREAIRQIVSSIRSAKKIPPRKFIEKIAKEVVGKYPKSFGDAVGSKGYEHFFEQLENRLYHCNRSSKLKPGLRATLSLGSLSDEDNKSSKSTPPKRIRDEHGSINWQPDKFPQDETKSTQQEKKEWLKAQKILNSNDEEIAISMSKTYALQRFDINKKNFTINALNVEWPYLFEREHFLAHANMLMGFNVEQQFKSELSQKVSTIVNFFRSLTQKSVASGKMKETMHDIDTYVLKSKSKVPEECALLTLLSKYFGEDESLFVQYFEKTMLKDDVLLKTSEKTKLPVIAVLGTNTLYDPECYVCIDDKVIGSKQNFKDQVIVLFIAYYVFNFQYPQDAAATLEFIQRGILKIDPIDGGHKRKGKRKRTVVHPKVHSLLNNLCTHESVWFKT